MPKTVDVYVLQEKIGSGQFGDVFRGYSKVDSRDVAIKTIRRDKIRGKFNELLENEIQVLRSCRNNNIVKLVDIKKTSNHIYLILEYCNQGDMQAYLKLRKRLPEEEAVECIIQILHAFQTLVKNKIMHRDFKLANVLRHDGVIKIADFGFAKLLEAQDQQVETILGSPLNMAPEVLNHEMYNSKADIWSIGVTFYQLLFGKVPYSASNIIDLLLKIRKDPLSLPYRVSPPVQDVLRKMLVVDPVKRIQWEQLFRHPIVRMLEERLGDNLQKSMLCDKNELPLSMSKFYIKTNKVVENMQDIRNRKQLNEHVCKVMHTKKPDPYNGTLIKRTTQRKEEADEKENKEGEYKLTLRATEKELREEEAVVEGRRNEGENAHTLRVKEGVRKILHYRNLYAFLGHVAEDLIQVNANSYGQCLAFLVLKKSMEEISGLRGSISKRRVEGIQRWQQLENSGDYKDLLQFMRSEEEVFSSFHEKLSLRVLEKGTLSTFQEDLMLSGRFTREQTNQRIYCRVLKEYVERASSSSEIAYPMAIHLIKVLDTLRLDELFSPSADFARYYQWFIATQENEVKTKCIAGLNQALKILQ